MTTMGALGAAGPGAGFGERARAAAQARDARQLPAAIGEAAPGAPHRALDGAGRGGDGVPFADVLTRVFEEADALQQRAETSVDDLLSGRSDDVHRVVLDMERANLGVRLAVEVRNRALEAYQEIMRMQL